MASSVPEEQKAQPREGVGDCSGILTGLCRHLYDLIGLVTVLNVEVKQNRSILFNFRDCVPLSLGSIS